MSVPTIRLVAERRGTSHSHRLVIQTSQAAQALINRTREFDALAFFEPDLRK
ncbi:MAG: hypothetical protein ACYCV7_01680 [Acidimicrobiales bacterium]